MPLLCVRFCRAGPFSAAVDNILSYLPRRNCFVLFTLMVLYSPWSVPYSFIPNFPHPRPRSDYPPPRVLTFSSLLQNQPYCSLCIYHPFVFLTLAPRPDVTEHMRGASQRTALGLFIASESRCCYVTCTCTNNLSSISPGTRVHLEIPRAPAPLP